MAKKLERNNIDIKDLSANSFTTASFNKALVPKEN